MADVIDFFLARSKKKIKKELEEQQKLEKQQQSVSDFLDQIAYENKLKKEKLEKERKENNDKVKRSYRLKKKQD